jgi:hypothetical protein
LAEFQPFQAIQILYEDDVGPTSSQSFDQRIHSCMAETGRFEGGTLDHTV